MIVTCSLLANACTQRISAPVLDLDNGVYWSHRYQSYLEVKDSLITRYQYTPSRCQAANAGLMPRVFSAAGPAGQHDWVAASYQTLVLQRRSDGIPVVFTREPFLPSSCRAEVVNTAAINFETLHYTLSQFNHPLPPSDVLRWRYEVERLDIDWQDSPLANRITLFELLSGVLDSSSDEHGFLLARDLERYHTVSSFTVGEAQREQSRRQLLQNLQQSQLSNGCERALWWGLLENGEYYIGVMRLQGLSAEASYSEMGHRCMQQALRAMEKDLNLVIQARGEAPKLLIDLRFNEGGSLLLASQLANSIQPSDAPLATIADHPIAVKRSPDLSRLHQGGRVLITEVTASAAEHLAQALRLRGFVLQGQNSRGAFSPTTVRELPNGWVLGISMYRPEEILDGRGNMLPEGVGLTPEDIVTAEKYFGL